MNTSSFFYKASLFIVIGILLVIAGCGDDEESSNSRPHTDDDYIIVTTQGASNVEPYAFSVVGHCRCEGSLPTNLQYGFLFGENPNPDQNNTIKINASKNTEYTFRAEMRGLKGGTTYYYRAFVFYNGKYYLGETKQETTLPDPFGMLTLYKQWLNVTRPSSPDEHGFVKHVYDFTTKSKLKVYAMKENGEWWKTNELPLSAVVIKEQLPDTLKGTYYTWRSNVNLEVWHDFICTKDTLYDFQGKSVPISGVYNTKSW